MASVACVQHFFLFWWKRENEENMAKKPRFWQIKQKCQKTHVFGPNNFFAKYVSPSNEFLHITYLKSVTICIFKKVTRLSKAKKELFVELNLLSSDSRLDINKSGMPRRLHMEVGQQGSYRRYDRYFWVEKYKISLIDWFVRRFDLK